MHTGRKGRYTARISLLMKRSDLGRVRFEAVLRSVHRFVRLVLARGRPASPLRPQVDEAVAGFSGTLNRGWRELA